VVGFSDYILYNNNSFKVAYFEDFMAKLIQRVGCGSTSRTICYEVENPKRKVDLAKLVHIGSDFWITPYKDVGPVKIYDEYHKYAKDLGTRIVEADFVLVGSIRSESFARQFEVTRGPIGFYILPKKG